MQIMDLPQDVREILERILGKNPEDVKPDEQAFLKARRDYLTNEHKRIFASVLGEQPVSEVPQAPVMPQPQPELPKANTQYVEEQQAPVEEPVQVVTEETTAADPIEETEIVPEEEVNPVQTAEVTTAMSEEENPYGGSNADPDQA